MAMSSSLPAIAAWNLAGEAAARSDSRSFRLRTSRVVRGAVWAAGAAGLGAAAIGIAAVAPIVVPIGAALGLFVGGIAGGLAMGGRAAKNERAEPQVPVFLGGLFGVVVGAAVGIASAFIAPLALVGVGLAGFGSAYVGGNLGQWGHEKWAGSDPVAHDVLAARKLKKSGQISQMLIAGEAKTDAFRMDLVQAASRNQISSNVIGIALADIDDQRKLWELRDSPNWYTRLCVARQTKDPELRASFVTDAAAIVRGELAQKGPEPLRRLLMNDDDWQVMQKIERSADDPDLSTAAGVRAQQLLEVWRHQAAADRTPLYGAPHMVPPTLNPPASPARMLD